MIDLIKKKIVILMIIWILLIFGFLLSCNEIPFDSPNNGDDPVVEISIALVTEVDEYTIYNGPHIATVSISNDTNTSDYYLGIPLRPNDFGDNNATNTNNNNVISFADPFYIAIEYTFSGDNLQQFLFPSPTNSFNYDAPSTESSGTFVIKMDSLALVLENALEYRFSILRKLENDTFVSHEYTLSLFYSM